MSKRASHPRNVLRRTTREFRVRWEIELDADSPRDAARKALEIQRDPSSTATVFHVFGPGGLSPQEVDLKDAP